MNTSIAEKMMQTDQFSQWLGISIEQAAPGTVTLMIIVRTEMCNGFGIAHGGIIFSLADSALAFASNSQGKHALSIENSISYVKAVQVSDTLTATASEISVTNKLGHYTVRIENQKQELVAVFKGTVYRKDIAW
jgi:acyl-CoA thioesterase